MKRSERIAHRGARLRVSVVALVVFGAIAPAGAADVARTSVDADVARTSVDADALGAISARGGRVVVPGFALSADRVVDLELERFSVTTPRTRFVVGPTSRPLAYDPSRVVLLRGRVAGDPGSHVFLAVSPSGSQGSIELSTDERYAISSRAAGGAPLPAGELSVFPAPAPGGGLAVPLCGVDPGAFATPDPPMERSAAIPTRLKHIELAVETDFEYFTLFGDSDAAGDYLVTLYGVVSDLYQRDVDAWIELVFARLWDDPDDLFNEPDPLVPFRDYWEKNEQGIDRDVAQFLSGRRDLPWGGVAYLRALCSSRGYSVAGYTLGFFTDPDRPDIYNRDPYVAGHEIGHNCAAPHTHSVDIDSCDDEESQPQRGTIMSYCTQTFTGGAANADLRFHTGIQDIMEDYFFNENPECLATDCNRNTVPDAIDIANQDSDDDNGNGVPDECEDCNGNERLDDADIDSGDSLDLNGNGIPDECEPDCNENDVPDDLDIAQGDSEDRYGDGVPDECDADCNDNGQSDYNEIQLDMSLDLNRNARLDSCEDCDDDGTLDLDALDHANNVWITGEQSRLREYLARTGTFTMESDDAGIAEGQDVIFDTERRILVSSGADHRVARFDIEGTSLGDFVPAGAGGLQGPGGLLLKPDGDLLVASAGTDSILEYDGATGDFEGAFIAPEAGGLSGPFGLAYGPNGNLFVTSQPGTVLEYDDAGQFVGVFVSPGDNGGLSTPKGILFLPTTGNLLVASYDTDQVLEYDGDTGAFVRQFSQVGTEDRLTLDQPWGVRLGPDGGVYVSRSHQHDKDGEGPERLHLTNARIYHFDIDTGFFLRTYILGVNSGILNPTGFAFAPDVDGIDCNLNLIPDACDIASGASLDKNGNGVPDECDGSCLADISGNGSVDFDDVLAVLGAWGNPGGPEDLDNSGEVDFDDLLIVLAAWGPCE